MRSPEKLRDDKSVFMNQGEWELLHILSNYKIFSVDNDDYYAEMKFHVSVEAGKWLKSNILQKTDEEMLHDHSFDELISIWICFDVLF